MLRCVLFGFFLYEVKQINETALLAGKAMLKSFAELKSVLLMSDPEGALRLVPITEPDDYYFAAGIGNKNNSYLLLMSLPHWVSKIRYSELFFQLWKLF